MTEDIGSKENFELVIKSLESFRERLQHKCVVAPTDTESSFFGVYPYDIKKAIEALNFAKPELIIN